MTNEVEITLKVVDKASAEIAKFGESLASIRQGLIEAEPQFARNKKALDDYMTSMFGGTGKGWN